MENWSAEGYLNGKFTNNLGSNCTLIAKDGIITGTYSTKPSRGKLTQDNFPIHGTYIPVKDGVLLSFIVTYKMEGLNNDGLEKFSTATWNGKVYSNKNSFKLNWLLVSNQTEENEWFATNLGQDHFTKVVDK